MELLQFLYAHIQEFVVFGLLLAVLLNNLREKPQPNRDLKNEPAKTLNKRMSDALHRAIFDEDDLIKRD